MEMFLVPKLQSTSKCNISTVSSASIEFWIIGNHQSSSHVELFTLSRLQPIVACQSIIGIVISKYSNHSESDSPSIVVQETKTLHDNGIPSLNSVEQLNSSQK